MCCVFFEFLWVLKGIDFTAGDMFTDLFKGTYAPTGHGICGQNVTPGSQDAERLPAPGGRGPRPGPWEGPSLKPKKWGGGRMGGGGVPAKS